MINLVIAIQSAMMHSKYAQLERDVCRVYAYYSNESASMNHTILMLGFMDGAIKIHFDQIKLLLKRLTSCLRRIKSGQSCTHSGFFFSASTLRAYPIDSLAKELATLDSALQHEIQACHKKITKRSRRKGFRVRASSY